MPDFSSEALRNAIKDLPPDQGGIGVVVKPGGDVGVQGAVSTSIGKGWSLSATGQWLKDAGYSAAAWVGWKGSSKT
jgi:hypothetical protein